MSATNRRNLRSGQPLWLAVGVPHFSAQPFEVSKKYGVIVVGAGITGAMLTGALSEAGFSVAVLDRRSPCLGSTAASTALLQFEIDTPLIELSTKVGPRGAGVAEILCSRIGSLRLGEGYRHSV